ncbi:MAG: hypothetical protein HKP52_01130, partial [Desulfofustis sp.]|nr:hypothetical protein [Desulfofustis sp.]
MVQLTQSDQVAGLNTFGDALSVIGNIHSASQSYLAGMARYTADFLIPYQLSCHYFYRTESKRLLKAPLGDSFEAYLGLLDNNLELINRSTSGTFEMMIAFARLVMPDCYETMGESFFRGDHHKLARFTERQAR